MMYFTIEGYSQVTANGVVTHHVTACPSEIVVRVRRRLFLEICEISRKELRLLPRRLDP